MNRGGRLTHAKICGFLRDGKVHMRVRRTIATTDLELTIEHDNIRLS